MTTRVRARSLTSCTAPALPAACLSLLLLLCAAGLASAQNIQQTSGAADLNLRSNLTVNPSTLALEFQVTLGGYPGRGGLSVTVTLNYSSKVWRVAYESYTPTVQVTFDG